MSELLTGTVTLFQYVLTGNCESCCEWLGLEESEEPNCEQTAYNIKTEKTTQKVALFIAYVAVSCITYGLA